MALELAPGVIDLRDAATWRTVARLEDPFGDRSTSIYFTPAGTELVAVARYSKAIHVWNLRAIRARLKAMGLDWDWPEYRPTITYGEGRSPRAASSLKIQVIGAGER
jgi:hypothetical protein